MEREVVGGKRIIDTFAARDLSAYEKKPSICYSLLLSLKIQIFGHIS